MTTESKNDVRRAVEGLLEQGFFAPTRDPALTVGEPIPIVDEAERLHSWFVPLQIGGRLAGFAQLLPTLEPLRVSSFQRSASGADDGPEVADWTDPQRVLERAAALAQHGEQLSQPVLSFDGSPSRLAWRVRATSATGRTRTLYVAGTAAYEATGARGLG